MLVSKLPDPSSYKNFTPKAPVVTFQESNYNLDEEIKKFELVNTGTIIYFELLEMFGRKFIGPLDFQHNPNLQAVNNDKVKVSAYLTHYRGEYNKFCTHSSLAIMLYDENKNLKTTAIRRYRTKSGDIVKWYKARGSKAKFIPYRLTDKYSYCFVAFGMAEALIFNILGLEYFILQSDSEAYHIDKNPYFQAIKERLGGRDILILPDYDESGFKAAAALKNHLKTFSNPTIIEFYKLIDNPQKGYDFRDYVLEVQDKELIIDNLLNLI
jgi:hypothetical protein